MEILSSRLHFVAQEKKFAKQVMIKLLSNLSAKGAKNALNYIIRNSESDFALNQDNELVEHIQNTKIVKEQEIKKYNLFLKGISK